MSLPEFTRGSTKMSARKTASHDKIKKPTKIGIEAHSIKNKIIEKWHQKESSYYAELKRASDVNRSDKSYKDELYSIQRSGRYIYFIGRLNPPHEGHIAALLSVVEEAIDSGGIAILLFGSGPNGGIQTSKDPIDFDLKSRFVIAKLKKELQIRHPDLNLNKMFEPGGQIQIEEMGKPVDQIRGIIQKDLLSNLFDELQTFRVSGEKDNGDDVKKLEWIEKALRAGILDKEGNIIPIETNILPFPAVSNVSGNAMSATQVRQDARTMSLDDFKEKYGDFYTTFTKEIYDVINQYPDIAYKSVKKTSVKAKTVKSPTIKSKTSRSPTIKSKTSRSPTIKSKTSRSPTIKSKTSRSSMVKGLGKNKSIKNKRIKKRHIKN
jgi:hypothetical protein